MSNSPLGARTGFTDTPRTTTYDKPFKTLAEQVTLLRERGMVIADEDAAMRTLGRISYYRLSGYWYIYRRRVDEPAGAERPERPEIGEDFVRGTTLDRVVELYEFDRRLRLHVLDGIERVEVALRMRLGHVLGASHAFAHLDPSALDPSFTLMDERNPVSSRAQWLDSKHAEWTRIVLAEEKRSNEDFVRHFKAKYGLPLPIWALTEILTFGNISVLLAGLKQPQRNSIASDFGIWTDRLEGDGAALVSWVAHLNSIRNTCAHHARLWNRNIEKQLGRLDGIGDLAHASGARSRARIYASLAVLAYLVARLDPRSTWRTDTVDLITEGLERVGQPPSRMGCPPGWSEQALWSASYIPSENPLSPEKREILSRFEYLNTAEVGLIIDPSATAKRRSSAVRYHRARGRLLGFPVGNTYRFPTFQLDRTEGRIIELAAYANEALDAKGHPWETGEWWASANSDLGGRTPMDMLANGELTHDLIDKALN
ncbi:Abi family protein [Nocardia sp. NPDC004068]|uniref:Abi family protein n=1 Tax=Nocardia sp. NPDC004068 TaxID=3364303 RepID=UPI0036D085E2